MFELKFDPLTRRFAPTSPRRGEVNVKFISTDIRTVTTQALLQVIASGLLMGLIYALVAVGLSLIFGLMDVVNFAHGEFMMLAMYATFGLVLTTTLDPVVLAPLVVALYVRARRHGLCRHHPLCHAPQGQPRHGADLRDLRARAPDPGPRAVPVHPDYKNIASTWLGGKTLNLGGVFLPWPQIYGGLVSLAVFAGLFWLITRTTSARRWRRRARTRARWRWSASTATACSRSAGGSVRRWWASPARCWRSSITSIRRSAAFRAGRLRRRRARGFGSIFGALVAGIIVGLVEALTTLLLPPALKSVGIYALYLAVLFIRPSGLFGKL